MQPADTICLRTSSGRLAFYLFHVRLDRQGDQEGCSEVNRVILRQLVEYVYDVLEDRQQFVVPLGDLSGRD